MRSLWDQDVKHLVIETSLKTLNGDTIDYISILKDSKLEVDLSIHFKSSIPKSLIPF